MPHGPAWVQPLPRLRIELADWSRRRNNEAPHAKLSLELIVDYRLGSFGKTQGGSKRPVSSLERLGDFEPLLTRLPY